MSPDDTTKCPPFLSREIIVHRGQPSRLPLRRPKRGLDGASPRCEGDSQMRECRALCRQIRGRAGHFYFAGKGDISTLPRHSLSQPVPASLGSALYFAATSVLTLGFGDFVAVGAPARIIITTAAITGLGVVALVVTFLFSLYGSYQRREMQVVALQAAAGAPPSAVALLETYSQLGLVGRLPELFIDWERWAVEVLDSHVAYPLLGFFRSSHDNLSWISALGTVLDAASLVLTTICEVPRGEAKLFKRVGAHLVEDIFNLGFRAGEATALDRSDFDAACDRLEEAGYTLEDRDQAWPVFKAARGAYAPRLEAMARYWATPAASWLGDPVVLRQPLHPADDP